MRTILVLAVVVTVSGCDKKQAKDPRFEGPMPIAFGDCAGPTVAWLSGPRPLPFTLEQADNHWVATTPAQTPASPPAREPTNQDPQLARQQAIEAARNAGVLGTATEGGAFASLTGTGDISTGFDDSNIFGDPLGNEAGELNGGFGRTGVGPANTGPSWGTIGTGRYGTIGHGSGTGIGYGTRRARSGAVPTVSIGQPNAQGDLDKAIIRRYIKRNIQKVTYCYEKQLLTKPHLQGTVSAQFFITPRGDVASASASGVDPEVASCVASVIKDIQFPKPKGGGGVQVIYPFTFRQAGDDGVPAGPGSGSGGSASDGSAAAGSAQPAAPAAGSAAAVDPAKSTRRIFRSADAGAVDASKYQPGVANPLRAEQAALTECFRKNPQHHGAVVVELGYDASGGVSNARVHGLDDERARSCVLEVAKRVKRAAPGSAAQRCSLSFGEMPLAALPAIDITGDAIKLDGKQLATVGEITGDDSPTATIHEVVDAIAARVKAVTAPTAPVVSIHGPLVIRPIDATPMKVLDRVLGSVLAGGDDFVLAIHGAQDWQLLSPMALPVIPVPFGTGGVWNHVKGKNRTRSATDDEHVTLSLLLAKDTIWIGLSRVNEFQELARDASLPDKLAAALKEHKASAFFADRADIEIAGEDAVTYRDLVNVIDVAAKAGFTDWQLTDPQGLAARPTL